MTPSVFRRRLLRRLPRQPEGIAVLGKWEPFLPARRCLAEVARRAAAALAISEALEPAGPGPYLLSAEGRLRGQPRAGCLLAAEILIELGAERQRIRISPAANRTSVEVEALEQMRQALGLASILCVTSDAHVERAGMLARRRGLGDQAIMVLGSGDELVREALATLPGPRSWVLLQRLSRSRAAGSAFPIDRFSEGLARLGSHFPRIEGWVADRVRGRVEPGQPLMEPPPCPEPFDP